MALLSTTHPSPLNSNNNNTNVRINWRWDFSSHNSSSKLNFPKLTLNSLIWKSKRRGRGNPKYKPQGPSLRNYSVTNLQLNKYYKRRFDLSPAEGTRSKYGSCSSHDAAFVTVLSSHNVQCSIVHPRKHSNAPSLWGGKWLTVISEFLNST